MHNVVKKLDQFACINPIKINNNVITATINGTMIDDNLKEIQSSFPGWKISVGTENGRAALIIEEERKENHYNDMADAFAAAVISSNRLFPFPLTEFTRAGRIILKSR